jgi:poly(A) polymerase/tRNA nucleotidyltransferase (CCA-adding enzyme)
MKIPEEVKFVLKELEKNGFEAFIVGGCVRDTLIKKEPSDWDITTSAKPKDIEKIFDETYSNNDFGTVTVRIKKTKDEFFETEITPYRIESKYTDKRHPDKIKWAKSLEEDLKRRDFTVNAMAISIKNARLEIVDLFNGQKDLKDKLIRAVGNPEDRFSEDALRMMRAVRFYSALGIGWEIERKTEEAIKKNSHFLSVISKERIRDELIKIVMSDKAKQGIELLRSLGLLKHIIPELEEGYKVGQNKHHIYDIYDHNLRCLDYAVKKDYGFYVRMAALLHDVAKPRTKEGEGIDSTFYNHEIVGAKMTRDILGRLKFSGKDIKMIVRLVRYHLFYYNVGEVSETSVRRLVRKVGLENIKELFQVRYCDRIGSGCPKAEPYKLRHLKYLVEKTSKDPVSVKMLMVSGKDIIEILNLSPGPKIGQILDILLGHVLACPNENKKDILTKKINELGRLSEKELRSLAEKAKKEREDIKTKQDNMTKKKYWVS